MEKNDKTKKPKLLKPDPKRTGNSVTGKPLDKVVVNPQLDVKEQNVDDVVLTYIIELRKQMNEELEAEGLMVEALNIQQRQKRAMIIRRWEGKIQRAKKIAQRKMAPPQIIKKRAFQLARQRVRMRVAGRRGAEYATLGPTEKEAIDRQVDKRVKLIKKIAQRLIPRVKAAEQRRLQSFLHGTKMTGPQSGSTSITSESFDFLNDLDLTNNDQLLPLIHDLVAESVDPKIRALKHNFSVHRLAESLLTPEDDKIQISEAAYRSLLKKSDKSGIDMDTILQVFERGYRTEENETYALQKAFARVNSFLNKGRTYYTEDADLQPSAKPMVEMRKIDGKWQKVIVEGKIETLPDNRSEVDKLFEKNGLWANIHAKRARGEKPRKPGSKGAPTKQAFKDASMKEMNLDPYKREVGTVDLTNTYKDDTPGEPTKVRQTIYNVPRNDKGKRSPTKQQEIEKKVTSESINESFNIVAAAGIGTTLTADDIGIKFKPAFEHHPAVIKEMNKRKQLEIQDEEDEGEE